VSAEGLKLEKIQLLSKVHIFRFIGNIEKRL
jgi:hypothetical protein